MDLIRPVFVVGMNGSGTTMLADSLGFHPELFMFPFEPRLLPYLVRKSRQYGTLRDIQHRRLIAAELCDARPFWHANGRVRLVLSDDELSEPGLDATIDAVFRNFARKVGKTRWGEKSPSNLLHMEALAGVFPHAKFVHIIRDGRDAAQSFERRFGFVPRETIFRWRLAIAKGQAQGAALGRNRYLEVRYEDLTEEPGRWMREVTDFLDLSFDPAVLRSSMRMAAPSVRDNTTGIVKNTGRWQQYFSQAEADALERISGRQLRELGYLVRIPGDDTPNRLFRYWWRFKGVFKRTVIHFRERGWAGAQGYLKLVRIAAKQRRVGR